MFWNYAIVAIRNLIKNPTFSIINIGGLTIGLAVVILISLFVREELGYDTFWKDHDRIYRMETDVNIPGRLPEAFGTSVPNYKEFLLKDFAEIEEVARVYHGQMVLIKDEVEIFERVNFVDPNFFNVLSMPFVDGTENSALQDSNSIILTERIAEKYFGTVHALDKIVTMVINGERKDLRVSGVVENLPENSHFFNDMIVLLDRNDFLREDGTTFLENWGGTSVYTYIKFKEGANVSGVNAGLADMTDRSAPKYLADYFERSVSEIFGHYLNPISEIYLKGPKSGRLKVAGDITTVQSFVGIAALILIISVLNFINLATVRSSLRSKEISLRKVFGAGQKDIMTQFLSETFVLIFIALLGALVLVEILLPLFNQAVSQLLELDILSDPLFLLGLSGLLVVVVIGAGFYPSFIVSKYRPADVLRQRKASSSFSGKLRTFFVVLQFSISIGLIISTAVIYSQTNYVSNRDLGYNKENIIVLRGLSRGGLQKTLKLLKPNC